MNTTVKLKENTLTELKKHGSMGMSWDDVIQVVLNKVKEGTKFKESTAATEFKTAMVDKYGKAMISRTLAGKPIEYREMK